MSWAARALQQKKQGVFSGQKVDIRIRVWNVREIPRLCDILSSH